MNIGVDGQLLIGKKTGMGVVLENILNRISPGDNKIFLYIPEGESLQDSPFLSNEKIIVKRLKKGNYFTWEQFVLPSRVKKDSLDCFWFPYNTAPFYLKCKLIITVHDLIFMHGSIFSPPTLYKKMGKAYRRFNIKFGIKKAYKIITISNDAKNEIIKFFPNEKNKISLCYNGTNISNEYLNDFEWDNFCKENKITNRFILAFGSLEERKNTMGSIMAYEKVRQKIKNIDLVLFGFRDYEKSKEYEYVNSKGIEGVHFLGYVSNKEKNTLYKRSLCFLFPSFSEGFGLPILEAFYNEIPVVTSNCSSMAEIADDAAVLVDPFNIEEIYEGIIQVLNSDNKELINKAKNRLKVFDWEKSAKIVEKLITEDKT